MKKIFTLFFVLLTTFSFGQSLRIIYDGVAYNDNDTVTAHITNLLSESNIYLDVANIGQTGVNVQVTKYEVSVLEGTENSFCFGEQCYAGNSSIYPVLIQPGDTFSHLNNINSFHAVYMPNNQEGISIVKYTFYNDDNESDQASIFVKLDSRRSTAIDNFGVVNVMKAYPNPATSNVTIDYKISNMNAQHSRIVIKNLMGGVIFSQNITQNEGKVMINLSNYMSGVYFYSIESNGKTLMTKKLVLK